MDYDQEESGLENKGFFSSLGMKMPEALVRDDGGREVGLGAKLRLGMESETGEEYSTLGAIASRMVPFAARGQRMMANDKTNALEDILDGGAVSDIKAMSPDEFAKAYPELFKADGGTEEEFYERQKNERVLNALNKAGFGGSDFTKSEEFLGKSADEKLEALRPQAEAELKRQTGVKQKAKETLGAADESGFWGTVAKGAVENTGYTLEYVVGAMLGGGIALPAAAAAMERQSNLSTSDYEIGKDGELVNKHNAYGEDEAALRGIAGGTLEAGVEAALGEAVGYVGKGALKLIGKMPGGAATIAALGKAGEAVGAAANKVPGVRALSWLGRQYDKVSALTQMQGWPEELAEEDVQAFVDDVVGLDKKKGEHKGYWNEWENFKRDTMSWNNQRDILVGMLGTMVVQGAYGAAKGAAQQRKIDEAAGALGGYTSKQAHEARGWLVGHGVSQRDADRLSDAQAAFTANLGMAVWQMSPEERAKLAETHGKRVADIAERVVRQQNFEYGQQLEEAGRSVELALPTGENGNIAWTDADFTDEETGEKKRGRVAVDTQNGIAVRDNGDWTYTIIDRRGNRQTIDGTGGEALALYYAENMAKKGALKDGENKTKEEVVKRIIAENYGNPEEGGFIIAGTANEAIDAMAKAGASEEDLASARWNLRDAPASLRSAAAVSGKNTILVLDNIKSENHAHELVRHEAIGHRSLANRFGGVEGVRKFLKSLDSKTLKDATARAVRNATARNLAQIAANGIAITPEIRKAAEQAAMKQMAEGEGLEEIFAHIVEKRSHNPLIRQRLLHRLREIGRAHGATTPIDDSELEVILGEMERQSAAGNGESNVKVVESLMTPEGYTFLRAEDAAQGEVEQPADIKTGDPAPETAEQSEENYGKIRAGVARAMTAATGREPTSSEVADAVTRLIDAPDWEAAMNAIGEMGLADDTELFEAVRAWHGGEAGGQAEPSSAIEAEKKPAAKAKSAPAAEPERPRAKFDSEASYHAKIMTQVDATEEPIDEIEVDNELVPNVKRNADPVTGEVAPIQGDPIDLASNPIVVWETKDGRKVVATGRHRYWLYKRVGRKTIPARVIREADGWTQKDILVLDAMSNIIDKKGTVNDYYEFFKRIAPTRAEAREARLLDTEIGRSAFSIYADATADTQGSVNWEEPAEYSEDQIPVEVAAQIASILPKDANPYHAGAQRAVIDTILKNPKMRGRKVEILARQLAWEAKVKAERGEGEGKKGGGFIQDDLFGADDSFMKEMAAIAEYRAKKAAGYRYDASVFANTSGRKAKDISLKGGKAAEYGITDATDVKQIKKAYDIAKAKERYWAEGELTPEDDAQMRKDLGLPPKMGTAVEPEKEEPAPEPPKEAEGQGDLFGGEEEKTEPKKEPKVEPEAKAEPEAKPAPKPAEKKEPAAKKEPKPKAERKPKKKSSLDLGDAEGALDDALDGLDGVFGAPTMLRFETPAAKFDAEAFGKQVTAVGKVVGVLASKGFTDFKSLATVIYEKKQELWPKVKPHLRKVWNAVAEDNGYEEVSKADAEAVFKALENPEEPVAVEPPKEAPKEEPKAETKPEEKEPPVVKENPPAPMPRSGKKDGFPKEEAGKVEFDLGGSEADRKEVADLIGEIKFESPFFAVAMKATTLANGETATSPVATAPRELTPAEKEQNRIVFAKLIKKLVDMGHKTFESFARAIANANWRLYNAVKKTLRGYWSDAVANGVVPEENDVTVRQANDTLAVIDDELADALDIQPAREDGRTKWTVKDQRDAYLALTNVEFAQRNPEAVKIANEMLAQGVPVSAFAKIENWWTRDDAAYWPVKGLRIENVQDAAALFQMLSNPYVEIYKVLYIDKNHRILEGRVVAIGSRTSVGVNYEDIAANVPEGTVGVIVSHNHPTGNVVPSGPVSGQRGDIQATEHLINFLNEKGLLLLDHIVTDTNRFTSMAVGASKGVNKVYGKMHMNIQAAEFWNPKIVGRGEGLYDFPPMPWENVPREQYGLGFYDGKHTKSIATFFAQQLSTHNQDRSYMVLLNDDQKVAGIIRVPTAEVAKKNGKLSEAVHEILKNHPEAANVMLYVGRERFDLAELAKGVIATQEREESPLPGVEGKFKGNPVYVSAVYSLSKGKFIGEKEYTSESSKFKLAGGKDFEPGYEEGLLAGSLPEVWDKDAKEISKRVPKALPLEVLPKKQYNIKQKKEIDDGNGQSGLDSGDAGGGERKQPSPEDAPLAEGGPEGVPGLDDRRGEVGHGDNGEVPGEGPGSGVRGGVPGGDISDRRGDDGVRTGLRGESAEDEGLHQNDLEDGGHRDDGDGADGRARDSVHLQPGQPDRQTPGENFIATEKVIEAWKRVSDESPAALVERAKANLEALDVLASLNWEDVADEDAADATLAAKRVFAPQREPTMAEKEALASFTGWYGFKSFVSDDELEAAYKQYQNLTEETTAAGIEPDEDAALASAAERTNNARHIPEGDERWVNAAVLKLYKELREMMPENLWREIRWGSHEGAYTGSLSDVESAIALPYETETAIMDAVSNAGLKGGYFINPLAGWGRDAAIAGSRFARDVNWTFFEPNKEKAQILRALYPKANVFNTRYRDTYSVNDFFDFAITVAPHDYLSADAHSHRAEDLVKGASKSENDILKLIRQIRPGGVAAIVMNEDAGRGLGGAAETNKSLARKIGMEGGRILGMLRVPATLAGYAGYKYGSLPKEASDYQAKVILVQRETTRTLNKDAVSGEDSLGAIPAENIIGFEIGKDEKWGEVVDGFTGYKGGDTQGEFRKAVERVMQNADGAALSDPNSARFVKRNDTAVKEASDGHPERETFIDGDTIKIKENGQIKRVRVGEGEKSRSGFEYAADAITGLTQKEALSIQRDYEKLRKALEDAIFADLSHDVAAVEKKKSLKAAYDAFVTKHGLVNNPKNLKVIERDKFNSGRVLGVIQIDRKTGEEFFVRFVTAEGTKTFLETNPFAKPENRTLPKDGNEAVQRSLTDKGYIDPTYIGRMLGMPARAAMQKLLDERVVFIDPSSQRYADRSEYLSGLVRTKYDAAKRAASIDSRFKANAEELQKVIQPMLSFDAANEADRPQVSARCGFIPVHIMRKFFRSIGIHGLEKIDYNKTAGRWIYLDDWKKVTLDNPSILRIGDKAQKSRHIKWWLDGKPAVIKDEETGQVDDEASEDVNNAFAELDRRLADFIMQNRGYKAEVETAFSRQLQDEFVERDYTGYNIVPPGLSKMWIDRMAEPERYYQRRAIAGVFYGDTQLLDHNVGSGKTAEMVSSLMAMKHYGKIRKPMFVTTPGALRQAHYEWIQLFPTAKLLVLETSDLSDPGKRLNTLALIKDNDWDGILLSNVSFKQFGMSEDFVNDIIEEQSVDYDAELAALKDTYGVKEAGDRGDRRRSTAEKDYDEQKKEVEDAKENALAQYQAMLKDAQANRAVPFDHTGIDYLCVDEAHYFKTVEAKTRKGTIRGVVTKNENSGLTKAMVPACYYLNKLHGGRHGVLFGTGTPLTNSFTEVYTMLNYLAPGLLREVGAPTLDSFLNEFCNFTTEFTPKIGGGFDAETVLSLANASPLSKLFRQVADVALAGQDYKVKDLPNRRDYIVQIPQSDVQRMSTLAIAQMAQDLEDGKKMPGVNEGYLKNYLGRTVAINPYLLGIRDAENARAKAQARIIKRFYDENPKMHHVIFTDLGAPKKFEYPQMSKVGSDAFQLIGKNGRLIDVGPRNPSTGERRLTVTVQFKEGLSYTESVSVNWRYLDDVPNQSTGGAPFNPAALHMALARLERKADIVFGKAKSVGQRKRGEAVSTGSVKAKSKLSGGTKFDFEAALKKQIGELGYDPRLSVIDSPAGFKAPPLRNKALADIYSSGGVQALDEELQKTPMWQFYGAHTFDEYSQMVNELVTVGIPADSIAIANSKEGIEAIVKQFNEPDGKVKVLITGAAAQEGINMQKVLWTLHHHDIPWMPGPKSQRDGRIWRPGNTNNPVHIFNYITPDSADGRSYTIVTRKQRLLFQIQTRPEHNKLEDVGAEAGSLAEMAALAIADKRVYWQDQLTKKLNRNRAIVDGEEKRLIDFNKSIKSFEGQQDRQRKIVDEYREELMPVFEKREAAKREFAIETPKGERLTTTKEILEYLSSVAKTAPAPVRRTAEEFTVGDYLTWLQFSEGETNEADIDNVNDFLAEEGITRDSGLGEYYKQADLVHRMHIENYLDSESTGEKTVGNLYGAPVKIVTRFSNSVSSTGGRTVIYSAEIEGLNAMMGMPMAPVMKDGRPDGEAPMGTEQGLQQMKGNVSRTLNPVSDNRPVPKAVANAEDMLMDINERLKAAKDGKERSQKSLDEAQGPIDSLEQKLQMLHESFMADSSGGAQPKVDFIENLEKYMKEGDEEGDEESQLYKVDGGKVLRDGAYDPAKHTKAPAGKGGNNTPDNTPPNGGGGGVRFETPGVAAMMGITNAEQDAALTERGMNAPKKRVRGDAKVMQGAEALESNAEFMRKLEHVVAKSPRSISAEENIAMARDWLKAKDEYDDLVESIVEAENAGDKEAVAELRRRMKSAESRMAEIVKAREGGVGEAARTLRTNRFLFDKDYSYAGLVAKRMADLGRPLTDAEFKELKDIADALKKLDEKERDIILAKIKAFADKAIRDFIEQAKEEQAKEPRGGNEVRRMLKKRAEALAQIEVLAYELGGSLDSLIPTGDAEDFASGSQFANMRKWLRNLAEYHIFHNPDIGEAELVQLLMDDIAPWFTADMHTVRSIFSGYGHSWKIDRTEEQRKVSDLMSQSRILEQILSLENNELPKLTGPQRSEPSDAARELMRLRDMLRRQKEREGLLPTTNNHLKTALESAKTRYEHMIADIKAALESGEKLPKKQPLGVTDDELEALKAEYRQLRDEYDRIWGKGQLTDEQKRQIAIGGLQRTLDRWAERLARAQAGDFTKPGARTRMGGEEIEALRRRIAEAKDAWAALKAAAHPNGTPEEIADLIRRRMDAITRAIQHWQTAMITGDIGPKPKKDIPWPDEKSRRDYEFAVEQRKRLYRKILDMREHDENMKKPYGLGYAKEYASFVSNAMRSLLATADFSAMMRQTSALTTAHLPTALKTLAATMKTFLSPAVAGRIDAELKANPIVREALDSGWLEWRDLEETGSSHDVEMFHGVDSSAITIGKNKDGTERRVSLGDIPVLGGLLHGSERQYASFINMMSAEIYTKLVQSPVWGKQGPSDKQKRDLAAYVNMANGSAQLGAKGKQAMNTLTAIFWAPKLAVSRFQLATGMGVVRPFFEGEKGEATAKERAKSAAVIALEQARAFLGAAAAGWLLMALFGDDDDKYEMEQAGAIDKALIAMKPRIGSTSIDMSGGITQWWKLLRMIATGTKRTSTGREIDLKNTYGRSLTQEIFRFAQGKFNPLISNTLALIEGKDYVGKEFSAWKLVKNAAIPLAAQDIWEAAFNENNGLGRGLLMAPFILTGAGGTTFDVDRFAVARNEFAARQKEYRAALKGGDYDRTKELLREFPELKQATRLEALFESAKKTEAMINKRRKRGLPDNPVLEDLLKRKQEAALAEFRRLR